MPPGRNYATGRSRYTRSLSPGCPIRLAPAPDRLLPCGPAAFWERAARLRPSRRPAPGGRGLGVGRAGPAEPGRTTVTIVVEGGMNSAHDLADRVHRRWLEENPFAATLYGI